MYWDGLPVCQSAVTHPSANHLIATRPRVELTTSIKLRRRLVWIIGLTTRCNSTSLTVVTQFSITTSSYCFSLYFRERSERKPGHDSFRARSVGNAEQILNVFGFQIFGRNPRQSYGEIQLTPATRSRLNCRKKYEFANSRHNRYRYAAAIKNFRQQWLYGCSEFHFSS